MTQLYIKIKSAEMLKINRRIQTMEIITEILAMVEKILNFSNEAEAAGIIEIIKNSLATIFSFIPMPL